MQQGPGSSGVFDALSCYLRLILKHSDLKNGIEKYMVNIFFFFFFVFIFLFFFFFFFWGGGGACTP